MTLKKDKLNWFTLFAQYFSQTHDNMTQQTDKTNMKRQTHLIPIVVHLFGIIESHEEKFKTFF